MDIAERKAAIRGDIEKALRRFAPSTKSSGQGGPLREEALLDEVTNLVQWPSVAVCDFDPAFLQVPAPAVEAAMMEHQRYFPVRDAAGALLPHFLVVSDRGPEHEALIRAGNERVLRARLADAQFFDRQDRKVRLADRVEALRGVAFLKGLGNYFDKTQRLEQLTKSVAEHLGLDDRDAAFAVRAARLCKADLLTEMVGEFPALQGEVGRICALRDGEPPEVAAAIAEHYLPRSADGELPASMAGRALSVAEKLDNLASCFAAGLIPSGSADPYALRRQSQGILRIVEASRPALRGFARWSRDALKGLPEPHCRADAAVPKAMEFLKDRLFQMALDRGAPHDLIHAALAPGFEDICDFRLRLEALRRLSAEPLLAGPGHRRRTDVQYQQGAAGGRGSRARALLRAAREGPLVALRDAPRRDRAAPGRARLRGGRAALRGGLRGAAARVLREGVRQRRGRARARQPADAAAADQPALLREIRRPGADRHRSPEMSPRRALRFTKMHGLGNDYVYVDLFKEKVPDPVALAVAVSDRHFGIGSDGLILIGPSRAGDVSMRVFNADGSEAQMCGNGIRCVAKYAYEHKLARSEEVRVETPAGVKSVRVQRRERPRDARARWTWASRACSARTSR